MYTVQSTVTKAMEYTEVYDADYDSEVDVSFVACCKQGSTIFRVKSVHLLTPGICKIVIAIKSN